MEKRKRRRQEESEAHRPELKPEVTDEEVDEFFSILRQVHAISKTFAGKGSSVAMAGAEETSTTATKREKPASRRRADEEQTSMWRPTFILEDFRVSGDAAAAAAISSEPADPTLDLDSESISEDVRL